MSQEQETQAEGAAAESGEAKPDTAVVKAEASESIKKFLERHREAIVSAAANRINPDRVLKVALLAATKAPLLSHPKTDRMSLLRAIVSAASLGLEAGSALGEAYLVPYFSKREGMYIVELIIGYRGLVALARRSGSIKGLDSRPVFEGEQFDVSYGTKPEIIHRPKFDAARTPDKLVAVYTVWNLEDGAIQFDVMSKAEVDAIRARSKAKDEGPWKTDYIEMAKKTVTRRSVKLVPMSIEMADALDEDARREFGDLDIAAIASEPAPAQPRIGAGAKLAEVAKTARAEDSPAEAHAAIVENVPSKRQRRLIDNEDTPGALTDDDREELRQMKHDHPEWFPAKTPAIGSAAPKAHSGHAPESALDG